MPHRTLCIITTTILCIVTTSNHFLVHNIGMKHNVDVGLKVHYGNDKNMNVLLISNLEFWWGEVGGGCCQTGHTLLKQQQQQQNINK